MGDTLTVDVLGSYIVVDLIISSTTDVDVDDNVVEDASTADVMGSKIIVIVSDITIDVETVTDSSVVDAKVSPPTATIDANDVVVDAEMIADLIPIY